MQVTKGNLLFKIGQDDLMVGHCTLQIPIGRFQVTLVRYAYPELLGDLVAGSRHNPFLEVTCARCLPGGLTRVGQGVVGAVLMGKLIQA